MALETLEKDVMAFSQASGLARELLLLDRAWEKEMGGLAQQAKVIAVDRTTLVIAAPSPVVRQELHLRKKELLRKLNAHFQRSWITNLTFRIESL